MPITNAQEEAAEAIQDAAAHDSSPQVRLVAGPGTGKSRAIEERVRWLLAQDVPADAIAVVSFTRASSNELRSRIRAYCHTHNQTEANNVRVSTLHSLALSLLSAAGLLQYPAPPLVLDNWELENVFDAEFGHSQHIGKRRREDIRREHEAFWNTGSWDPPTTSRRIRLLRTPNVQVSQPFTDHVLRPTRASYQVRLFGSASNTS